MINIGVIGYGYWGPNLVRNFAETAGRDGRGRRGPRPEEARAGAAALSRR